MDRYTVESVDPYDMEPAPYGMWVMYDDAQAAIAEEREKCADVRMFPSVMAFAPEDEHGRRCYEAGIRHMREAIRANLTTPTKPVP